MDLSETRMVAIMGEKVMIFAFILTHGRTDKFLTYRTLRWRVGGKIFNVADDEEDHGTVHWLNLRIGAGIFPKSILPVVLMKPIMIAAQFLRP